MNKLVLPSKKHILFFTVLLLIIIAWSGFAWIKKETNKGYKVASQYYELVKNGEFLSAVDLIYFSPNREFLRELMPQLYAKDLLETYDIINVRKVNNALFEVDVDVKVKNENSERLTNYIAQISEKWMFLITKDDVPPEIYEYPDAKLGAVKISPIERRQGDG